MFRQFGGRSIQTATQQAIVNEQWNGSNWTEIADLNTARYELAGWRNYLYSQH